jgi:excisionase family DNA binding protein
MVSEDQYPLTPKIAAKYIGVGVSTLRWWRAEGRGPRWFRAGQKLIRYRRCDLDQWIAANLNAPVEAKNDCR